MAICCTRVSGCVGYVWQGYRTDLEGQQMAGPIHTWSQLESQ